MKAKQKTNQPTRAIAVFIFLILAAVLAWAANQFFFPVAPTGARSFDGELAYDDVEYQVGLGPRIPGTPGHDKIVSWIEQELKDDGWRVEIQESQSMGHTIRNIVARRGPAFGQKDPQWFILGAHYDTRMFADHDEDPSKQDEPVPGANDGASGVAVLLELARALPKNLDKEVWLVFFDAEDNGRISGWDWILGSRAFVDQLEGKPDGVVVVDMIGDADLNIYMEKSSDLALKTSIWAKAASLGYEQFINSPKYSMLDDHTPFLEAGIPAVDLIDFDYPYWHTTQDTPDKVSAESLDAVGETLLAWLAVPGN
ncbi:MAG: M28 family peptidase [Chloroflexota bacterium]|nr:MAG: M28 family peptidase [Chloroflexota bacterium]